MQILEGDYAAPAGAIVLLASRFNDLIVDGLIRGATDTLKRHGVDDSRLTLVRVAGAWELPWAAEQLAATGRYAGIVALGCVVRGATAHFDYVSGGAINGLMQVSLKHGLPVGLGVLTTDTLEQALDRAGAKAGNKGSDAALALIEQLNLKARIAGVQA
jgi:6,7-dimethyl-8-ribityllumazine synthase